jgi:hypothetical protein
MSNVRGLIRKRPHSRVWNVAVAIVFLVQGWVTTAPLLEGRGVGMSAHIEAPGAQGHFTHDESSCAACTVLSMPALGVALRPFMVQPGHSSTPMPFVALANTEQVLLLQRSRAPPSVR